MLKVKYKFKLKKNHFFFGNLKLKIAKLYIRRSYTNVFITLCDLNNKVIICKSSGSSDNIKNKRRKHFRIVNEVTAFHISFQPKSSKCINWNVHAQVNYCMI